MWISRVSLALCLALLLTAALTGCIPEELPVDSNDVVESEESDSGSENDSSDEPSPETPTANEPEDETTIPMPLLPATEFDYVAYADTNLPGHFRNGPNGVVTVVQQDNTPADNPITNAGATLGRVLFYDVNLSANNAVSCASCHQQDVGFSDPDTLSTGFQGGLTGRHSMSLSNNRFYEPGNFFWDHRADTLEDQVLMPIEDTVEMGMTLEDLEVKLAQLPYYAELFTNAFGDDEITSDRISKALAQFTRAMVSYQSKYDQAFEQSQPGQGPAFAEVFTADEEAGRLLFEQGPPDGGAGCGACHAGVAQITDEAHNIGLDVTNIDEGAGDGRFKVPSLRNIAVSAPYMHDGRFESLAEVINHYDSGVQNNPDLDPILRNPVNGQPARLNLSDQQKQQLEAFLNTLTDDALLTSGLFADPFPSEDTDI